MRSLALQRLGQTMESGRIECWLKSEGEAYAAGEPLYEVETDKVTVEVEAPEAGQLARILVQPSEEATVGSVIAIVADAGEAWTPADVDTFLAAAVAESSPAAPASANGDRAPAGQPAADVAVPAMPRARVRARELGVDLAEVQPSGSGGVITVGDVERTAASSGPGPLVRERRDLTPLERRMARLMTDSWQTVPQFVQHVEVRADELLATREQLRSEDVTVGDLLLSAFVHAVDEVPDVNAEYRADGSVLLYEDVNVALAVATARGLLVPVLHRAQQLNLPERSRAARELAGRAHNGTLERSDVEGATVTFSNLGAAGVHLGTPLVTVPQAAILFTGAIRSDDAGAARLWLSGAFDHRIVDGATAASFMAALKQRIESATF